MLNMELKRIREKLTSAQGSGQPAAAPASHARPRRTKSPLFHTGVTRMDRWLVRKMMAVVGNPPVRISLWDGNEVTPECEHPLAELVYSDRAALLRTIINPELYWGDLYCTGRVTFEGNLTRFLEVIYRGIRSLGKPGPVRRMIVWLGHRRIFNTQDRARENIHHHYDIGNTFYSLWLDKAAMQYTCAYFPHDNMSLEEAQLAKLHHVCRKLQLRPGDRVVEAGCGWGGLARFMAKHYGARVTAYNISREQVSYARQKAEQEGLSGQVEYVLDDYRNIRGQYDVFISVGMLEHVGQRDYQRLGEIIRHCLRPEGRGLIHTIGRINRGPMNAWIERRIFPGARPPALSELAQVFEPNQLSVLDIENIRLHYARTLELWNERFEEHRNTISDMMDEEFVRAWSLYLHGSTAAFNTGELQLYQVVFTHAMNNDIPWSRHYMYDPVIERPHGKTRLTVVPSGSERD
jgi:cyclopropane-fatty-acyl-phospholipid synthase